MLCENCKQNEASVYVSEMVNGQKTEHYLCENCVKASEESMGSEGILFNNFISELMKIALEEGYLKSPKNPPQKACPSCGLSLKEFLEIGRFGCKACYETFNNELKNAFVNVHGNAKHVGKEVELQSNINNFLKEQERTSSIQSIKNCEEEINQLEEALKRSIKEEAYEEAARLRDKIRALKKGGAS
ncbi:UvrB/UvrC motif-containing protein [Cellulosilyticum sp. I15G10I2]|uniref:UvrB/UvrC motif-containing protein n=1 Tax=Cellulosilyticum sp. I15G10I2 TaxID=1892843 RepID=UPI00085C61C0|nr:UvrB/UvrC motif-containing protein [Cellulosilyticum sp. I15G10I2]